MSSEYIFEINDALYDHETGKVCMMPKIVGALIRCKDCKHHQKDTIFKKLYCDCDGREVVAYGFCEKGERDETD